MICVFCQYTPVTHYVFGTKHVTVGRQLYIISDTKVCSHGTADALDRT